MKGENKKRSVGLIQTRRIFGFGEHTRGRRSMNQGDHVCFYSKQTGIFAHAKVKTKPRLDSSVISEDYPYFYELDEASVFLKRPDVEILVINENLRRRLDAFAGRDPERAWAWFVQGPHRITKHDYDLLVGWEVVTRSVILGSSSVRSKV